MVDVGGRQRGWAQVLETGKVKIDARLDRAMERERGPQPTSKAKEVRGSRLVGVGQKGGGIGFGTD